MKKYLTILLIAAIITGVIPSAFAAGPLDNFKKQRDYDNRFTDVKKADWFYDSVCMGFEFNLIGGVSDTSFAPTGELTIAEILALASRLHSICFNGQSSFTQGSPWYQVYVDYARTNGFLLPDLDSYNRNALRGEVAAILAKALPASALLPFNTIEDGSIPDVRMDAPYASAIYTLYRSGILTGSDEYGTFHPDTNIKRSEIAAIISRIVNPDTREDKTFMKLEELYFAFFDVISTSSVKTSIPGVIMRFHGDVPKIYSDNFTDIVLTRDGEKIDNPLVMGKDVSHAEWFYEEITDFYFKFEKAITEPGRYSLTGRYGGVPFTVYDKIIEKPVGNVPADPNDLLYVQWSYTTDKNDAPERISEVIFCFKGTQQSFSQSDITNLKLTRNGSEIKFSFEKGVYRYLEADGSGVDTQYNLLFSDGGITAPGTYQLSGKYREKAFTSAEITIK